VKQKGVEWDRRHILERIRIQSEVVRREKC
jgi:hypothetical protein